MLLFVLCWIQNGRISEQGTFCFRVMEKFDANIIVAYPAGYELCHPVCYTGFQCAVLDGETYMDSSVRESRLRPITLFASRPDC